MKSEKMSEAIGLIDDELIEKADKKRKKRGVSRLFRMSAMAVATVALASSICLVLVEIMSKVEPTTVYAISEAKYPDTVAYPKEEDFIDAKTGEVDYEGYEEKYMEWNEARRKQNSYAQDYTDGMKNYCKNTTKQFLYGSEEENQTYSPLNVYMALSMLAEVTDGNSRKQILSLLGENSIENLRTQANALWNANYINDGATTSILANSFWLNDEREYNKKTLTTLMEQYYASSYQGEMGSEGYDKKLQDWLSEQTGGLLKDQASEIKMKRETIMALASTIYFNAKWSEEFFEAETKKATFHGYNKAVETDFMNQSFMDTYYWGKNFGVVEKKFQNGGSMWLVLPDETTTAKELLESDEVFQMIDMGDGWKEQKELKINLSMPKFDVTSDFDLSDGLKKLGVTDVFDEAVSDFSPMTENAKGIILSKASHAVRVQVDEEGCSAAAFTVLQMVGTSAPADEVKEIDFVLDRPFLFFITGADGLPLFAGIVNQVEN